MVEYNFLYIYVYYYFSDCRKKKKLKIRYENSHPNLSAFIKLLNTQVEKKSLGNIVIMWKLICRVFLCVRVKVEFMLLLVREKSESTRMTFFFVYLLAVRIVIWFFDCAQICMKNIFQVSEYFVHVLLWRG